MKLATFNMENIFYRDENLIKKSLSHSVSAWMEEFEELMRRESRMHREYARMRELCFLLGFHKSSLQPYVILRRKAGQLFLRQRSGEPDYKAGPGTNWNGWIKLHSRPINDVAVTNKGRVITEVNPDILIVQEIEDRQSLLGFNEGYLSEEVRFSEIYSIEGNDEYSRSMGIMTKKEYRVNSVISHSNEWWKDCLLYTSPSPRDRTRYRMPSSA